MSTPPREIRKARVVRYAGDPTWHELDDDERPEVGVETVDALAVVDYGGSFRGNDPDGDHYILRLHGGWASDDWRGDRANAIKFFAAEVVELGLTEVAMLPAPWHDLKCRRFPPEPADDAAPAGVRGEPHLPVGDGEMRGDMRRV